DEDLLLLWRRIPEHLRHVPRAVRIEDEEAVAVFLQVPVDPDEGLGRRALEEGAGLAVEDRAHEVVRGRVADVELDRGVGGDDLDEVGLEELAGLDRWRRGQCFGPELLYGPD